MSRVVSRQLLSRLPQQEDATLIPIGDLDPNDCLVLASRLRTMGRGERVHLDLSQVSHMDEQASRLLHRHLERGEA